MVNVVSRKLRFKFFAKKQFSWQNSEFLRETRSHPFIVENLFHSKKITRTEQEQWYWDVYSNDFDFLIGTRSTRANVLSRKIISFVSRLVVKLFYGKGVHDVNSPYRLMRVSVFRDHFLSIKPGTFAPNVIVSAIACKRKLRIYEKTMDYNFRQQGEVSIKKLKLLKVAVISFFQAICFRFRL